jgi:hypothetical protein
MDWEYWVLIQKDLKKIHEILFSEKKRPEKKKKKKNTPKIYTPNNPFL